jgi:hypothetical protein
MLLLRQTIYRHLHRSRAQNSPGRLTISAARTNTVRLIRRTVRPQRIPSGRSASLGQIACLGRRGVGG